MENTLLVIWEAVKEFIITAGQAFGKMIYTIVDATFGVDIFMGYAVIFLILSGTLILMSNRINETLKKEIM